MAKLKEQRIDQMQGVLTTLAIAQDRLSDLANRVHVAESIYRDKMRGLGQELSDLRAAMDNDVTVRQIRAEHDEALKLFQEAYNWAQSEAVNAWRNGYTDSKQWQDGEWEVRLRTTTKPTVTDLPAFIGEVVELGAFDAIESVKLNHNVAVSLASALKVEGLEITEDTTASVVRVSKVNNGKENE